MNILKKNYTFLLLSLLYILVGSSFLFFIQKGDVVLALNGLHSPFLDFFFGNLTHLGDGVFIALVTVGWIFRSKWQGVILAISCVVNALVIQLLKYSFAYPRPASVLDPSAYHAVAGVKLNHYLSFPSGHTNGAFALLFGVAFLSNNKLVQTICAIMAMFIALSRIYLVQHFLMDTVAGAGIALVVSWLVFYIAIEKTGLKNKLN